MTDRRRITPVILSGGSGTRLWPLSRTATPKQFLSLTGDETMFQLTVARTQDGARFAPPIIVSNAAHADLIEEQMAEIGVTPAALILEPVGRNTAPAIALAAFAAEPEDLLLVMPSDHVITDVAAFQRAIDALAPQVEEGWLATFGITPDHPETGYGYIRMGEAIAPGVHRVDSFVEKPNRETAERFLAEGNYAWNGGIFLFRAGSFLEALAEHCPDILTAVGAAMEARYEEGGRVFPKTAAFAAAPNDSVDYAVMEKAAKVAVAPVDMGWSDVGSWDALHALAKRDDHGNVHQGEVRAIETHNCFIRSDGPVVATVGISDLIVIATDDAVLIMPRGESQNVKRAIEDLKSIGHSSLDVFSRREKRP
jgi:mannose-1-phosphate guanylyltransferase